MNLITLLARNVQHRNNDARIAANPNNYSVFQQNDIPYLLDGSDYHKLDIYSPDEKSGILPVIVEIHGGGYVSCFKEYNRQHGQYLASKGFHVVNMNYTLYPEGDYRTSVKDVFCVLSWIRNHAGEHGFDTQNVFLTGDSAGGHLVLCTAAAVTKRSSAVYFGVDKPEIMPKGYALTCPAGDTRDLISEGEGLDMLKLSMGKLLRDREYMTQSSYHFFMKDGFPEVFILTTPSDNVVYLHTRRLHQEMECMGIHHIYKEYISRENLLEHVFNVTYPDYAESREANDDIIQYFSHLARGNSQKMKPPALRYPEQKDGSGNPSPDKNWNIIWHQALSAPLMGGILEKRDRTVSFNIEIPRDCQKLRFRLLCHYGKRAGRIDGLCLVCQNRLYPITFKGKRSFSIPVDSPIYTDELDLPLHEGSTVEVRIYNKGGFSDCNSIEEDAKMFKGNAANSLSLPSTISQLKILKEQGVFPGIPYIDRIEIFSEGKQKNIIVFGDSITAMNRWTRPLAKRLQEAYGSSYALINSGIIGNCLSYEYPGRLYRSFGEKGVRRAYRDVLDIPDAYAVILALGINDICYQNEKNTSELNVKALIRETEKLVSIFRGKGLRVIGQTLSPGMGYNGACGSFTEKKEQDRQEFNTWLKNCGLFDYVADPEAILLEEGTTDTFKKGLHQGDHLHPSKNGGEAIADVYDLSKLTGEIK
jgi:acetyl esterase/lipase/lysophospholipase L1-like esterase